LRRNVNSQLKTILEVVYLYGSVKVNLVLPANYISDVDRIFTAGAKPSCPLIFSHLPSPPLPSPVNGRSGVLSRNILKFYIAVGEF